MFDTLSALIAWARDQGANWLDFVWFLVLGLLLWGMLKVGKFAGGAAAGVWQRYEGMLDSLASELAQAKKDLADERRANEHMRHELRVAEEALALYRARMDHWTPLHMRQDDGN